MWREYFKQKYLVKDGMLICSADYLDHGPCFSMPVGSGDLASSLEFIKSYCKANDIPLRFCCITEDGVTKLAEYLGEPSSVIEYRDWADYIYPYENFLGYHGKKLVTPRNHCNRFMREYPQYEYLPLSPAALGKAKDFLIENSAAFEKPAPLAKEDYHRSIEVLDHAEAFGFTGGMLSVDGRIIGLSVGETVGDTLYVHIEKALKEYSGAYPFLASLYAKQNASDSIRFINREDDSGDEGLRHSKLEYHPCGIINKYVVCFE